MYFVFHIITEENGQHVGTHLAFAAQTLVQACICGLGLFCCNLFS